MMWQDKLQMQTTGQWL